MAGRAIVGILAESAGTRLDKIVDEILGRHDEYRRVVDYYEGRHRIRLTARAKKYLQASGLPYAHNFMERVVDAATDRLEIEGVEVRVTLPELEPIDPSEPPVAGAPPADPGVVTTEVERDLNAEASRIVSAWLEQHLDDIGFDEIADIVHHDAVLKGDGYATAYWDDDNGRPEIATEDPESCAPFYPQGKRHHLDCVAKRWLEDHVGDDGATLTLERLTLYYDDRIEKYGRVNGGEWQAWHDDEDGYDLVVDETTELETSVPRWPVPWVRAALVDGETEELLEEPAARGLAVGHFRNKTRGKRYGVSEIRTVLPQQDALNKRMIDLDLVSDSQGYAQRWATGVTTTSKLHGHPGSVWRTPNKDARFGQFDAGDPTGILSIIDKGVSHLAATTATALHDLMIEGEPPSGEALKTAEGPAVKKTERKQRTFGRQWSALLVQILRIAIDHELIDLPGLADAKITVDVHWSSAETRDERAHWEVVSLKQAAGVSRSTTLVEDGYDADRERQLRALDATAATAGLAASMRAGNEFGEAPA